MKQGQIIGLSTEEAKERQLKYGKNEISHTKKKNFWYNFFHVLKEPMFILLLSVSLIYFILGEKTDGIIMLVFVNVIIWIEIIQEWKTDRTLQALKELSDPTVIVYRDNKKIEIKSHELVPGDVIYISEGVKIPADGFVIKESTLLVDESSLTGESIGVWKKKYTDEPSDSYFRDDYCYAGTLVISGSALIEVDKIGFETEYGKIGKKASEAPLDKPPLQVQVDKLVSISAKFAFTLFLVVSLVTYFNISDHTFTDRIIESVLAGITIAMAMIPEEFPVILTVFLSMGAWRLAKKNSLVRDLPSVETLGAVSVLCVDKTGTITMNKMAVSQIYTHSTDRNNLLQKMKLACKKDAYDPMEKAMLSYYELNSALDNNKYELIKEYPFTNENKMMANLYSSNNKIILSAKGSSENILKLCNLSNDEIVNINKEIEKMASLGLRVIAIADANIENKELIPKKLIDSKLNFIGLVGLADAPRETVSEDIARCYKAGIRVVMITGDNGLTASSIANKVGIKNSNLIIKGSEIDKMTDEELRQKVKEVNIFSRVIPEHKMRIVRAFKANGEVVAMTGDGVNDAPALKYADIGIAMGKVGTEVSREAADLILLDDNFSTIVETIHDGRRIYDNIKKAVGYVLSIHVIIALASLFAPLLGIAPVNLLLLPIHIVLLELIIDPTCSIVLERQPAEKDIMSRCPRSSNDKLITASLAIKSIMQGLIIFIVSFGMYLLFLNITPEQPAFARTVALGIIIVSNVLLIQVNLSESDFIVTNIINTLKDKVMTLSSIGTIVLFFGMLYTPIGDYLKLTPLTFSQVIMILIMSLLAVIWYEIFKILKKQP